jgi:hypothetical protein
MKLFPDFAHHAHMQEHIILQSLQSAQLLEFNPRPVMQKVALSALHGGDSFLIGFLSQSLFNSVR